MSLAGALEPIFSEALRAQVTPGGVVAIAENSEPLATIPFGDTASPSDEGRAVSRDTIYDLASLTKPMATTALCMQAIANGTIELSRRIADLDPWLDRPGARAIEVRHLLGHAAGLPAHVRFFEAIFRARSSRGSNRDPKNQLLSLAGDVELTDRPGERAVYSDIGYIILGSMLERVLDKPLDELFATAIAGPLGADSLGYRLEDDIGDRERIAPTERAPDRAGELLRGVVHDENARAGGGPFGHAGLFGTADEVLAFALDLDAAIRGEASALFETGVAREFITMSAAPDTTWKLGWDTPSPLPVQSHAGDLWSRDGFGHLGYTGTSLWLDPGHGRAVVILTNRVYYSRDAAPIRDFRRAIMDAIVTELT